MPRVSEKDFNENTHSKFNESREQYIQSIEYSLHQFANDFEKVEIYETYMPHGNITEISVKLKTLYHENLKKLRFVKKKKMKSTFDLNSSFRMNSPRVSAGRSGNKRTSMSKFKSGSRVELGDRAYATATRRRTIKEDSKSADREDDQPVLTHLSRSQRKKSTGGTSNENGIAFSFRPNGID